MSRLLSLASVLTGVALLATPLMAQSGRNSGQLGSAPYSGAFDRQFPETGALLHAFEVTHGTVLERLYSGSGTAAEQLDRELISQLLDSARKGVPAKEASLKSVAPSFARFAPEVVEVLEWGHGLHRAVYDIYADDRTTDKKAAVDQAVDLYLSRSDLALVAQPKSMRIVDGQTFASAFQSGYPQLNGLVWASHWLQVAVADPLIFYPTPQARKEGVDTVRQRYLDLLADAPENFPRQMPTPPAVTPELVNGHPRAAAIIANTHMLHAVVADILADGQLTDKRAALDLAIAEFQDASRYTSSEYDWILSSLRHGIYDQGGPAIGRLERRERNRDDHGDHVVLPGMGGPTGSGMPGGGGGGM